MNTSFDRCYRAVVARDRRFDGVFFCAVRTTGIYCRPSCPARTPKRENMSFFATAAAAQGAGYRACKRCRPDAVPGPPDWDRGADVVARAMRLIADGVVDRDGIVGLASRLGYSERHLHRLLVDGVGAGPLALARAQRTQTARVLLETTELGISEVALAAGFGSVRQFNQTMRQVFATTPRELRRRARRGRVSGPGELTVRLPYRAPFDAPGLLGFLAARALPGVEEAVAEGFRRSLRLPHAGGVVELQPAVGHVAATLWLQDHRDVVAAVQRCRQLLDLDCDPEPIDQLLSDDPLLAPLITRAPGRRVPGHVDGAELAIRAVLGQQVSVVGATTLAGRLVRTHGEPLAHPVGAVTHLFPSSAALTRLDRRELAMPTARAAAVCRLAETLAGGDLVLDSGADRADASTRLLAIPGIGPWTAAYMAMRALRDPDAFPAEDLGVRRGLRRLGASGPAGAAAERWRPYRAYATQHLWDCAARSESPPLTRAA